ncbi:uncharacterized protein LOC116122308 [Pistacia vera]|uniref:uncharacterized protein LOC116122308 n=1 Tax=Pistacia vera TaxID=55513 RepID=UPI00126368B2|nr:uncharacterized protein LOC116122308 [Pistacia vera]
MGKRRDRTMAAISNAGRRVKLDLSAEPSGDLGGSSVNDEVGKDTESKELAGLPKSPSSSGQTQQNPLLLLGQYSDDEIDEESNGQLQQAVVENSAVDDGKQTLYHWGVTEKGLQSIAQEYLYALKMSSNLNK